jgi:hypothetical protein
MQRQEVNGKHEHNLKGVNNIPVAHGMYTHTRFGEKYGSVV